MSSIYESMMEIQTMASAGARRRSPLGQHLIAGVGERHAVKNKHSSTAAAAHVRNDAARVPGDAVAQHIVVGRNAVEHLLDRLHLRFRLRALRQQRSPCRRP